MYKENKIVIKQIANPDNPTVGIKYVGAKEYATVKKGRDGKNVTGVDEHALEIVSLPEPEAKKKTAEIKKIRENLEKILGQDLSPDSAFWNDFAIVLEDEITLDPLNPRDQLIERVLIANRYVAPCEEDIENDDRFQNCMFYMHRDEEVLTKKAVRQISEDAATARLYSLNEDNPAKLKIVAAYIFGFDASIDISAEESYVKLREFISIEDDVERKKNVKSFMDAAAKSPEEMITKQILDKAIKKKIITSRGNVYRRGDDIYGNSYEEALEFLSLPEHSGELAYLRKVVDK